ncbi:MAG TPA: prepilin-type N-terminal cleavage/methylation domain-containing protein [Xanthomonadales bacterium]|nr:prepilin-type N-terminal cleavage/methylation domain-containing protein [Xanthomonadales bacterium]
MRARSHGFSLLEVLLALVLLGLLMAGALTGIRTATRSLESGESLIERTNKIRVAQEFLRRQISNALALPFEVKQPTGEPVVMLGERDELTWVSGMPGHMSRGGAYVQRLTFERGNNGTQLVFRHAIPKPVTERSPGDDLFEDAEREPVILLEHIRSARFEYRALDDRGRLGDWKDDWDMPGRSPLLVRVEIEFDRESRLAWPEFVVPLMIDPGAITTALEPTFFMGTQQ